MKKIKKITAAALIITAAVFIFASCAENGSKTGSSPAISSSSEISSSAEAASSKTEAKSKISVSSKPSVSSSSQRKELKTETPKVTAKTVTLTVDASKAGEGYYVNSKKVEIKSGETVYDVLKEWCTKNNKILAAKGKGTNVYVASINGLSEFAKGGASGWIYSVNGKMPAESCGAYKLNGGEKIKWIYTLDNGQTEARGG